MTNKDFLLTVVDKLKADAEQSSIEFDNGKLNYPYAYGYIASSFGHLLSDLNLSKRQLKLLATLVEHL